MKALLRTLRGLMGIGLTWGTLWAMTILVIGLVIWLVDPASMRLEASVPAEQLREVRIGSRVSFTVNGSIRSGS